MVKTYRGHELDMQALALQNENTIAIGNVKMNARGDLLGRGGIIVKTREQIVREHLDAQQAAGTVDTRGNFRSLNQEDPAQTTQDPPVPVQQSKGKKLSAQKNESIETNQSLGDNE